MRISLCITLQGLTLYQTPYMNRRCRASQSIVQANSKNAICDFLCEKIATHPPIIRNALHLQKNGELLRWSLSMCDSWNLWVCCVWKIYRFSVHTCVSLKVSLDQVLYLYNFLSIIFCSCDYHAMLLMRIPPCMCGVGYFVCARAKHRNVQSKTNCSVFADNILVLVCW